MHRTRTLATGTIALTLVAVACGPGASAAPTAEPTASLVATGATASPSPSLAPSTEPTVLPTLAPAPLPSGVLAWPTAFDTPLEEATYFSSPPFRIPFTLVVGEPGWGTGHLHADFFDLLRFDGVAHEQLPNRMLAFADSDYVIGVHGNVGVATLTPRAALDLLAERPDLTVSTREQVELFGLAGERLNVHSATGSNHVFGGAGGDLGIGPELDTRLAFLPLNGRLLGVLVMAEADDLQAAWDQALRILDTVDLVTADH